MDTFAEVNARLARHHDHQPVRRGRETEMTDPTFVFAILGGVASLVAGSALLVGSLLGAGAILASAAGGVETSTTNRERHDAGRSR